MSRFFGGGLSFPLLLTLAWDSVRGFFFVPRRALLVRRALVFFGKLTPCEAGARCLSLVPDPTLRRGLGVHNRLVLITMVSFRQNGARFGSGPPVVFLWPNCDYFLFVNYLEFHRRRCGRAGTILGPP